MSIPKASLKFSAYAWAKLQYVLRATKNEVGMFGISLKEDPLSIIDLAILKQKVTSASVEFDQEGIANFYDDCIDKGMNINQYSRVWIHTHPSGIYSPSSTDEKTFLDTFGNCDWAVMYILTKDNKDYCALQYNKFPANRVELIGQRVDFSIPFPKSNADEWKKELETFVEEKVFVVPVKKDVAKVFSKSSLPRKQFKEKVHYKFEEDNFFEDELDLDWEDEFNYLGNLKGYFK